MPANLSYFRTDLDALWSHGCASARCYSSLLLLTPATPPPPAFVRVRPALAGEGRYFVRVPRGTNAEDYQVPLPGYISQDRLDIRSGADDGLDGDARGQLFLKFLEARDGGYQGEFGGKIIIL